MESLKLEIITDFHYGFEIGMESAVEFRSLTCIFIFIKSHEKSEGMLIETGYAFAKKKKIFLVIKEGIKTTFIHQIANKVIEFKDIEDLLIKLKEFSV